MQYDFSSAGLLIVGHGSTVNPDSSAPSLAHAAEIRRRGRFASVHCCFWKEEPSMRDALLLFEEAGTQVVYVVPNFISEGYFTQTIIPRELELSGRTTARISGQMWQYCEPVGNHPAMTSLLLQRAHTVAPGVLESETSLLIVGHGTSLNDNSAVAAKREVEAIRLMNRYAAVLNTYMEEPPLVSDWQKFTDTPHVVVVPFFISDGLHSYQDIPVLLGIQREATAAASAQEVFRRNPYTLAGRSVHYASAIGTEPKFADIIIEQAEAFTRDPRSLSQNFARGLVA
ncbi:MAG: cobalamin biosynthesis protein CbiX [Chthoniobacterales bacterium]|nr:cobalamin biosynthesis protein CbiX [Chthoniobacterales bacterium]